MPNLLRFPIVLICIAIFSLWYLGSRDGDSSTSFEQQRDKLVLRVEKDLRSTRPRVAGKRRASIRAQPTTNAASFAAGGPSISPPIECENTRARIVGLKPLEAESDGAREPDRARTVPTQLPSRFPFEPTSPRPFSEGNKVTFQARAGVANRTHRIVDGDDLHQLAESYLGDATRYLEIFEANRDKLSSPDLLPLGKDLAIPSANPPRP